VFYTVQFTISFTLEGGITAILDRQASRSPQLCSLICLLKQGYFEKMANLMHSDTEATSFRVKLSPANRRRRLVPLLGVILSVSLAMKHTRLTLLSPLVEFAESIPPSSTLWKSNLQRFWIKIESWNFKPFGIVFIWTAYGCST